MPKIPGPLAGLISSVKLSERSISAIADVITGDKGLSRYRSGPKLVRLFNEHGGDDVCGAEISSGEEQQLVRCHTASDQTSAWALGQPAARSMGRA